MARPAQSLACFLEPGTPGWGSRLMCKACLVRGRGSRDGGGEVGKREREGSRGPALRRERRPGPGRGRCQREKPGAEKMVETERGGRENGGRPAEEEAGQSVPRVHRRGQRREAKMRGEV